MIVRILGEGQLEVPDSAVDRLNELDDRLQATVDSGDAEAFGPALEALLAEVRGVGTRLPDDALMPSDAMVPASGASLEEVRELLGDEGLIPG